MNRLILLTALLVPMCLAGLDSHKQAMIKDNKTPKEAAPADFNNACDECKVVVTEFKEAMKDPAKMAELKNLLSVLCDSTSYPRECKFFVGRLDEIVKELAPYMDDPTAVCTKLRMCGNARLQKVHRLALIYAKKYLNRVQGRNDMVCEECQFAVAELKGMVEERGSQEEIKQYISYYICKHLGQYQGACDELVDQFLPELFEELQHFLENSKQVCADLGLCQGQRVRISGQRLHPADSTNVGQSQVPKTYRLMSFYRTLNNLQTKNGVFMNCIECDLAVATMLGALETETVRGPIVADLNAAVCTDVLPTDFKDGCSDFLGIYLDTVFAMSVDLFTANELCADLHMCDAAKSRTIKRLSATEKATAVCESCKGITDYVRNEINDPGFESEIAFGLQQYLCVKMPLSVQNLCDNVIKSYTPMVLQKVAGMLNSQTICKDDLHMCTTELLQQINDQ